MIRLWIRPDGEPKAIALDAAVAPGPGPIVDVREVRDVAAARYLYSISRRPEPDESTDPQGWLAWRAARRLVKEVSP